MRVKPTLLRKMLCLLGCLALAATAGAQEQDLEPIQLHYHERPPYAHTLDDGTITGIIARPAETAMRRAELPLQVGQNTE